MPDYRINAPELAQLVERLDQSPVYLREQMQIAMGEAVHAAAEEIAARTPVRTGALRASITTAVAGAGDNVTGTVTIGKGLNYARPVEFGTRPHDIIARNARALRFTPAGGGGPIFRTRVHHPGTKAVGMVSEGARAAEPRIRAIFRMVLERVAARIAGRG